MTKQRIYIERYKWVVWIYYAATPYNSVEIMCKLQELGCRGTDLMGAFNNLRSGKMNQGITYSNNLMRESVMVISVTSSPDEFQSSFDHEKGHLCRHICQAFGIDPYGEEAQYLAGDIGMLLFPVAKRFICACQ